MKPVDQKTIEIFDRSLRRCNANPGFLDLFYEKFLAASPKVRERFANTDFARQKRLLHASFYLILLASEDPENGPARYLDHLAARHSVHDLNIGAELYDIWLDSLLAVVKECDPEFDDSIEESWERIMGIGIDYMLQHYNKRQ
jgi:hemoglobin-like flavoprotein